ncbi:MAG: hypothetical protein GYB64_15475, partial [Chloroflexi bacterium]|nr:hypothetical protein [Chloroflexota bacterium]
MPPSLRISVLLLLAALACNLPTTPPTATIEATPQPTQPAAVVLPTATAQPPLPPGSIWVGVEGLSRRVAIVTPEGNVTLQELPLPPGQQASTLTPTPAGLAFIMWDANGAQRGAGLWASTGLVELARTEPGFRMIDLLAGEEALAVLQVAADTPLAEADWLVGTVPLAGGRFAPVADRASVGDIPPPDLFAWPGPLLLNAAAPDGTSQGIFALDTASGA